MHLLSFFLLIAFSSVSVCILVDKCFLANASRHALAFRIICFILLVAVCLTLICVSMSMCMQTRYSFGACLAFPFKSLPY